MLEASEKAAKLKGTTDAKKKRFGVTTMFIFTKEGCPTIRYLFELDEEPFTIEIETGDNKTRRKFFGDEDLRKKLNAYVEDAFPKKKK